MKDKSLVSVKDEPRSTSHLSSALFLLPLFYLHDLNLRALTCVAKNASSREESHDNNGIFILCLNTKKTRVILFILFECLCIYHESTNRMNYFYVFYRRPWTASFERCHLTRAEVQLIAGQLFFIRKQTLNTYKFETKRTNSKIIQLINIQYVYFLKE